VYPARPNEIRQKKEVRTKNAALQQVATICIDERLQAALAPAEPGGIS
jgi:hypothetical protein